LSLRKLVAVAVLVAAWSTILVPGAGARMPKPSGFGPGIEGYSGYQGQSKCDPSAKPGVLAFQRMVLAAYPWTGWGGISRACSVGGQSEHKEGRAWDWGVNVGVTSQRAAAESLIDWLTAKDRYGNEAAMARRVGLMYMIWNRRIWFPWGGWQTYCVQKKRGCLDPDDKSPRHPHTDHVHFSFTWDGATKRTSYWNKDRSLIAGASAPLGANGLWVLGRNGGIAAMNLGYHGSKSDTAVRKPIVAMASSPSGYGYWLVSKIGQVSAFGDAPHKGGAKGTMSNTAGIAATPSGRGYWLAGAGGAVKAFGDAVYKGRLTDAGSPVTGIASTASGLGYWLVTANGRVVPFGDAVFHGGLAGDASDVRGILPTSSGLGYWLFTSKGRVTPFGDAGFFGGLADKSLTQDIVGMTRSATGSGYWLVGEKGKIDSFGDAPLLGAARTLGRARPPELEIPMVLPGD
jgi:hypothetical protein